MKDRKRINISVDFATYKKLQMVVGKYHFKNIGEVLISFMNILLDRLESTERRKYDFPDDDGEYIDRMFDELGHVEPTPDGTVPVRHNNKQMK